MSTAEEVFDGVLDLTGADESAGSFEAFPGGTYQAVIVGSDNTTWKKVKMESQGKLAGGTPYLNVEIRLTTEAAADGTKLKNKRVFGKLFVPAEGTIPQEKLAWHRGMFKNFLKAVGYTEEQMSKKGFRIDPDELAGRELTVVVDRKKSTTTDEFENNVRGYKPAGESADTAGQPI